MDDVVETTTTDVVAPPVGQASSNATSETVGQWLLDNANQKGSADFNIMVDEYRRLQVAEEFSYLSPSTAPEAEKLGILGTIKEGFTGEARHTPEVDTLPKAGGMPELQFALSMPQLKAAFGTLMGNQREMAQVIKANFPDVEVRYDARGNPVLRSGLNGREYIISPGLDLGDVPRMAGSAALFSILRGKGILGTAVQGGGTQLGYEALQTAVGGEFGIPEVLTATLAGPVLVVLGMGLRTGYNNTVGRFLNKEAPPSTAATQPLISDEEIVELTRRAARGDNAAIRTLQELGAPDEQVLAAARRLGIAENLQPDHLTTSQVFREIAQAAKSVPGSRVAAAEAKGLNEVGERAVNLIDELGGTPDLSSISAQVRQRIQTMLDDLGAIENTTWTQLRNGITPSRTTNPQSIMGYLEQRIAEVGGDVKDLFPLERQVFNALKIKDVMGRVDGKSVVVGQKAPTYGLLDKWRRQVGRATRGRGPFGDEDVGVAKQLYKYLNNDVAAVADEVGLAAVYQEAKNATGLIAAAEADMLSLFGKDLQKSLVPALKGGIQGMSQGNADNFLNLVNSIPPELRRPVVISSVINSFGKATKNGELNFNSYANWYQGLLRNRRAKAQFDRLIGPQARRTFNDLYVISNNVNRAITEKIRTGRPRPAIMEGLNEADSLLNRLWEISKRSTIGLPIEGGLQMIGLPGLGIGTAIAYNVGRTGSRPKAVEALNNVMSSPAFLRTMREAGTDQEQAAAAELAASRPFQQFLTAVGMPLDQGEQVILGAFQAARSGYQSAPDEVITETEEIEVPAPPVPSPQASVAPPAPPTRGVPGLESTASPPVETAATPVSAPPANMAQGPEGPVAPSSKEMLQDLFPFDPLVG